MVYTKRTTRQGFTLIELLVAIAILAILSVVIAPAVVQYVSKARKTQAKSVLKTLESAITMYQVDVGKYPSKLEDIVKPPADPKDRKKWMEGGYLKKAELPLDPWGEDYKYHLTPGGPHPYELYSTGPNKEEATKEEYLSAWED